MSKLVDDGFLRQAQQDAEKVKQWPEATRRRIEADTDWLGYQMRAYEFPTRPAPTR